MSRVRVSYPALKRQSERRVRLRGDSAFSHLVSGPLSGPCWLRVFGPGLRLYDSSTPDPTSTVSGVTRLGSRQTTHGDNSRRQLKPLTHSAAYPAFSKSVALSTADFAGALRDCRQNPLFGSSASAVRSSLNIHWMAQSRSNRSPFQVVSFSAKTCACWRGAVAEGAMARSRARGRRACGTPMQRQRCAVR